MDGVINLNWDCNVSRITNLYYLQILDIHVKKKWNVVNSKIVMLQAQSIHTVH